MRRGLSWIIGLGIGVALGVSCVAAAISTTKPIDKLLGGLGPASVESTPSIAPGGPTATVRSFLLLERAALFGRMARFVTERARLDWFDPKTWGGEGRLVRFDVLGPDPTTRQPRPGGAWTIVAEESYQLAGNEIVRRRFVYRVVRADGKWLIDDYEVGSTEEP